MDTDSVGITHNTDKNNPQRIAFSKCQASLAAATDLEQYRQGLIQTLKKFGDQENEETTEDAVLSDDSYVDPEFILYGRPMSQSR